MTRGQAVGVAAAVSVLIVAGLFTQRRDQEEAPWAVHAAAGQYIVRYQEGCGGVLEAPRFVVEDLGGEKWDVTEGLLGTDTVAIDASLLAKYPDQVIHGTVPHALTHILVTRKTGAASPIHTGQFNLMEAYLRGAISKCPWRVE